MTTGVKTGRTAEGTPELLSTILNGLSEAIVAFDREHRISYFNRAASDLLTALKAGQGSVRELFADSQFAESLCLNTFAGEPFEGWAEMATPEGGRRTMDVRSRLLPDMELGLLTLQPGTAPSNNAAAWGSDESFRELAESIPQLVWSTRPDGYTDYFNQNWMNYVGRPFEEVAGEAWSAALHPEDRQSTLQAWRKAVETGVTYDVEYRLRRFDGPYRWFKARGTPVRNADGKVVRWSGTSTDIDDQVSAELALAESERRFRELAEAVPQIVFAAAADGTTTYVNFRTLQITGFSYERALDREAWKEIVHPDDWPRLTRRWKEAMDTSEPFELEYRICDARTGQFRQFLARAVAVRDDMGRLVQWFGTATDIDDQRRTEEMLRHKQKLDTIGLLAGGIAHDFNNLLVGVMGAASCARELIAPDPFPEDHPAVEMLDLVIKSGDRAAHLTRQLLAYSGKSRFILESCDVPAFIRDSFDLLRASIAREVSLQLDLDNGVPAIEVDKSQLQQIVMNLVINGAEATGAVSTAMIVIRTRAVRLTRKEAARFSYDELKAGRYVLLEVEDNGCGMSEETRGKIFDPFFTTKFTGRGLGLSAVSGIVRGMRGAIDVTSQVGSGTTFRVYFPTAARDATEAPPEATPETAPQAPKPGRGKILVVDDEASVLFVAERALASGGYEAVAEANGVDALRAFTAGNGSFVAALIDLSMPGMAGEQLVACLRELDPDLPVIVSSGHGERDVYARVERFGNIVLLPKPYTSRHLLDEVGRLLSNT